MKALFCTDGSKISFNALKNFAHWGREVVVDVFCSVDYSFLPSTFALEIEEFETSCSMIAGNILQEAREEIHELGMTFGRQIQYCGETVTGILDTAKRGGYELILMGSNGKKGLQRWLGSVSRDVINHAETSVYISKNENQAKKILFATDGTSNSKLAVSDAIKYINLNDKEIHACVVLENPNLLFLEGAIDTNWLMRINEVQKKFADDILSDFKKNLSEYGLTPKDCVVLEGIPAEKITDYAKQNEIDLIVSGTRTGRKSFLETSVSKRIAEITTSDVVIFR